MSDIHTSSRPSEEPEESSYSYRRWRKIVPIAVPCLTVFVIVTAALGVYYGTDALFPKESSRNISLINNQHNEKSKHAKLQSRKLSENELNNTKQTKGAQMQNVGSHFILDPNPTPKIHIMAKTALNVTNAIKMCAATHVNGILAFPKSLEEEETMMASFINVYEKEKKSLVLCDDQYFIGLRKILDEEWVGPDGKLAAFGPPISVLKYNRHHDFANEHCTQILLDGNNYYINNIRCHSHVWNCFVCQHPCGVDIPDIPYCFSVHRDVRVRSYNDALSFCQFLMKSSSLAIVPHKSVLKKITSEMYLKNCKNAGIGHKFSGRYESMSGFKLPYITNRVYYRPGGRKHISYSCIVINAANNFEWEVESCSKHRCFVCFSYGT